jgi:hypothetical protein
VIDWIDPVLKRVVAKGDTWRNAISEHVTLLDSAVGTNRTSGGEGKALVNWMAEQAYVLSDLLNKGVLPDESGGGIDSIVPGDSGVLRGPVGSEVDSVAHRAAVLHRDPPTRVIDKPTVLPDLWWRVQEPVSIDLLTVESCTLEQARAYVEGQQRWRVLVDDNLALVLARIRQALWDENFLLGWIDRPPYRDWPVEFRLYPNFMVRWMSGGSKIEGRLGYESTRERALVWVGHYFEANELVPWSSLTVGDHWLSAAEFPRRNQSDR